MIFYVKNIIFLQLYDTTANSFIRLHCERTTTKNDGLFAFCVLWPSDDELVYIFSAHNKCGHSALYRRAMQVSRKNI